MVGGVLWLDKFNISKNVQFLKGYLLEANGISGQRVISMCIDIITIQKISNEKYKE